MPEIDGLRFIAIATVVLFHIKVFLDAKDKHVYSDLLDYSSLKYVVSHGHLGVMLFFVISGFILGLPFAKHQLNHEKPVSLKKYFLKRITRLEPPYIVAMTVLFFGAVYVAKSLTLKWGLISYLSSITYTHNLFFPNQLPFLNVSAWSLEVEIQFYLLAPLMAYVYRIKSAQSRRALLSATAILCVIHDCFNPMPFLSLISFMQFFLMGYLLADLYVSKETIFPRTKFDPIIGFCFFCLIWLFDKQDFTSPFLMAGWEIIQLGAMFFFYYYVLFHQVFKWLWLPYITNIGGMCYSIYLLHFPIISVVGNPLMNISFTSYAFINTSIYAIVLIGSILAISSVFYLLIERPCMDSNWYRKIFRRKQAVDSKVKISAESMNVQ